MAGKVQDLTKVIAEEYGNDAGRVWTEAVDVRARLQRPPAGAEPASAR
jgi:hypothetical protein